jgi:hypothetical protein
VENNKICILHPNSDCPEPVIRYGSPLSIFVFETRLNCEYTHVYFLTEAILQKLQNPHSCTKMEAELMQILWKNRGYGNHVYECFISKYCYWNQGLKMCIALKSFNISHKLLECLFITQRLKRVPIKWKVNLHSLLPLVTYIHEALSSSSAYIR